MISTSARPVRSHLPTALVALLTWTLLAPAPTRAADPLEAIQRELESLRRRVTALEEENVRLKKEIDVERIVVRKELVVSDTGEPWERGYAAQQIPRGIYARSLGNGPGGLWVRSRLIKGEIDDPFDDRFHALEQDGSLRRTPGHISWNVWLDGAWRQMAIIQGEGLEFSETPRAQWSGSTHPGRIRLQTFRPGHGEPLTDAVIGQGRMSIGGGGYGGGGLPAPNDVLELWGGTITQHALTTPEAPKVVAHDNSGEHTYAIIAIGPKGNTSPTSSTTKAGGLARLRWESVAGADAYFVVRDGARVAGPLRIEGSAKEWKDSGTPVR